MAALNSKAGAGATGLHRSKAWCYRDLVGTSTQHDPVPRFASVGPPTSPAYFWYLPEIVGEPPFIGGFASYELAETPDFTLFCPLFAESLWRPISAPTPSCRRGFESFVRHPCCPSSWFRKGATIALSIRGGADCCLRGTAGAHLPARRQRSFLSRGQNV